MTNENTLDNTIINNIARARKKGLYSNLYKNLQKGYTFEQIPFLERKHLLDHKIPTTMSDESGCVYFTSGTTARPKALYYNMRELQYLQEYVKWFCRVENIAGGEKVAVLLGQSFWGTGYITAQGHILAGNEVTPIDTGLSEESIIEIINQYQPTVISSYATFLMKLKGIYCPSLKLIETTGELLDKKTRTRLERNYGVPVFDAYGLTEGVIGTECEYHDGYHFRPDMVHLEIIDPISLKQMPDEKWGELVLTVLSDSAMPIIRYRTNDICKISRKQCKCEHISPRIWIQGRRREQIMLLYDGVKISTADIRHVLVRYFGKSVAYAIKNKTTASGTTIIIAINSSDKVKIALAKHAIEELNYEMLYLLNLKKLRIMFKIKKI